MYAITETLRASTGLNAAAWLRTSIPAAPSTRPSTAYVTSLPPKKMPISFDVFFNELFSVPVKNGSRTGAQYMAQ
jgi:hypothetical protein